MAITLAEVLQHFGPQYLRSHAVSTPQARAWRAIVACRTPALGGEHLRCDGCGAQQSRWHSCRNRHCPRCQSRDREAWTSARVGELLDVPYCHLVFTLPHELNGLAAVHARWVYDTLMRCTAATLTEFAANPRWLGGTGAFTLVLHTWPQDLRRHVHVHALMACSSTPKAAGAGAAPGARPASCSRCMRCRGCCAASSCRPCMRWARPVRCRAIRPARRLHGSSACRPCAGTTGWSTRRRRWPDPRPCCSTSRATPIAPPSATSGYWGSRTTRSCCVCAPTRPIEIECCPHCKTAHCRVVEHLPANRIALSRTALAVPPPACRSPR